MDFQPLRASDQHASSIDHTHMKSTYLQWKVWHCRLQTNKQKKQKKKNPKKTPRWNVTVSFRGSLNLHITRAFLWCHHNRVNFEGITSLFGVENDPTVSVKIKYSWAAYDLFSQREGREDIKRELWILPYHTEHIFSLVASNPEAVK